MLGWCLSFDRCELVTNVTSHVKTFLTDSRSESVHYVQTAGAIRSKNIVIRSNGSSYPFKKYCHPFERLELSVQKNNIAIRSKQLKIYVQKILSSVERLSTLS